MARLQLRRQRWHLGIANQRQPAGGGQETQRQDGGERQRQSPGPAAGAGGGILGGERHQQGRGRNCRQPVTGQLGGRHGEEQQHRHQPTGRKPPQGQRRCRRSPGPCPPEAQQQQRRAGQTGQHQHQQKKPPGLLVMVHHRGESLQVVIAKETAPEGLPLHQQGRAVPGQGHQRGERQAPEGLEPPPQAP